MILANNEGQWVIDTGTADSTIVFRSARVPRFVPPGTRADALPSVPRVKRLCTLSAPKFPLEQRERRQERDPLGWQPGLRLYLCPESALFGTIGNSDNPEMARGIRHQDIDVIHGARNIGHDADLLLSYSLALGDSRLWR
jgi:hypothetical protein